MPHTSGHEAQLTIIGTGIAGLAAAIFAAQQGIDAALIEASGSGASDFSSGLLDLCGPIPSGSKGEQTNPWQAISSLIRSEPNHPYAQIEQTDIAAAFNQCLSALDRAGLSYHGQEQSNCEAITPAGTTKQTYRIPASMLAGPEALAENAPCLLIDFHGLKDFSGAMIRAVLHDRWPNLRQARIAFPGNEGRSELFTGLLARSLDAPPGVERLAEAVRPLLGESQFLGFPAVLGVNRTDRIVAELEDRLGVRVFEIPTLPPAVPGTRFREACQRILSGSTVRTLTCQWLRLLGSAPGSYTLGLEQQERSLQLRTGAIILASGRFLGQGLVADRTAVRESIFDLPVHQPESRQGWHRQDLFDPKGHPINTAGLEVDHLFRPVDSSGHAVFEGLFACGSILAHQDWMRSQCGAGLSLSTAYRAVAASLGQAQPSPGGLSG